jgi:hypothetical protein
MLIVCMLKENKMKELGDALKLIFSKVAGFFDIFDLSFFVSGITSAAAIATFLHLAGVTVTTILASKIGIFLAALASYSLGLVSFALGRQFQRAVSLVLNKKELKVAEEQFRETLKAHRLAEQQPFKNYLPKEKKKLTKEEKKKLKEEEKEESNRIQALYTRLWAEIRHSEQISASLELLNSYWVKAATHDGLAVSFLLWSAVFLCNTFGWVVQNCLGRPISAFLATFFLGASLTCLKEARRYREYQAKELVATIAAIRSK